MTEQERKDARKLMLYDLRLLIKSNEKGQYSKEELLNFIDIIADAEDKA